MNILSSGIYAIVNNDSGKVYVGSTVQTFKLRWAHHRNALRHRYHRNRHLQHAWNKYGESAFEFMVLEYVDNPELSTEREQYWLDFCRLLTDVYNVGVKVDSVMYGQKHTEESIQKMREAHSGEGNPMFGRPITEEHRRKLSIAAKGKKVSEKVRLRWAQAYPAFINEKTGGRINAGVNLTAICRELDLSPQRMWEVKKGLRTAYKGWVLDN